MNISTPAQKRLLWAIIINLAVIMLLFLYIIHRRHNDSVIVLFEGAFRVCPKEAPQYFPSLDYNLSSYGSGEEGKMEEKPLPNQPAIHAATAASTNEKSAQALELRLPTVYRDRRPYQSLQVLYPEDGSLYPPNIAEPYVKWEDPANNRWLISIEFGNPKESRFFLSDKKRWRFPAKLWKELCENAVKADAVLQVKGIQVANGKREGGIQASEPVRFHIAEDPADNFVVYRIVTPPFSSKKTPDIRIRDIRKDKDKVFLSSERQYCINCHTFSSKMGNQGKLAMQIRSLGEANANAKAPDLKMYLAIYDIDHHTGFKARFPFEVQMSTFMAWSPDGTKLAYSANQKLATLSPVTFETQHASTITSDIAIYDIAQNKTYLLPEASDPNWLENYPCWSPDGSKFVFARGPGGQHPAVLRYDLQVMRGKEKPVPIPGASNNEHSNYFPRFSPDGKWMSFCQCDGGDLIRSSSDIYLIDGEFKGLPKRLEFNVENAADSWHSWSSNSRWLVFVSKREDGTFASLYFSHIDDNGHASPAVPLPLETEPLSSFNIPEFIANEPPIQDKELFDAIRVEQPARAVMSDE